MFSKMTDLIIDADSIVYASAFASQDYGLFSPDGQLVNIFSSLKDAKEEADGDTEIEINPVPRKVGDVEENTDAIINNIIDSFDNVTGVELYLTVSDLTKNFRYSVSEDYKANRKDFVKPYHYSTVRDFLLNKWDAKISRDGWEADDELSAIGWQHWNKQERGSRTVLCSIDKDLDTVPGEHFRWRTHNKDEEHYELSEHQARFNYWCQVLTGDSADNIKGLYRIGAKKAGSILNECVTDLDFYKTCLKQWEINYEKYGIDSDPVEDMHTTCKLLYLMRHDDDKGFKPPIEEQRDGAL